MFNFDEKRFYPAERCTHAGHFPHENPRYTMTEEIENTAVQMRETIDRLLRFEERCKADFDRLSQNVGADNSIFKTTMREAWVTFLQEVKNEINMFEGNVDATVALFQKDTESNYATLSEDVRNQVRANYLEFSDKVTAFETAYVEAFDTYKKLINNDVEQYNTNHVQAFAEHVADVENRFTNAYNALVETHNEAVAYMKTNLTSTMLTVVNELITAGTVDTITLDAYNELKKDVYGSGLSDQEIESIKNAKAINTLNITVPNKVYDLKGATINTLNLQATGVTIKNATVKDCNIAAGSRNCIFEGVRFENAVQCITFGANTWAFNFKDCSFIGTGDTVAMNAGTNTNTTLNLTNCYFYKCAKIIYATGGFVCTVSGGWCDDAKQFIHVTAGNCDIAFNGFDFEVIDNIFKADGYTYTNIYVNGVIGAAAAVVDYTDGIVNLVYDATLNNNVKLFSANCPATHYCNVPTAAGCCYPFNGSATEKTVSVYLPPNSSICILNACHVQKIVFENANAEIYTKYGKYTPGSTLNAVTPVYVRNLADTGNNFSMVVTTYNNL